MPYSPNIFYYYSFLTGRSFRLRFTYSDKDMEVHFKKKRILVLLGSDLGSEFKIQISFMFNQWCTIESDPGVFTDLVKKIGAPTVQVEQIYSMEDDQLITVVQPHIYGFIFLFKWTRDIEKRDALVDYDPELFFARQIVNNACATQAILSVLLNAPITIEGDLKEFYQFTKDLTCEDRGLCLSNSEAIRLLHNSFSRPEPFIFKEDKKKKKKEADIYHFVSYVPHKGNLYELDGLQLGPILIGKYEGEKGWIDLAKKEILNRIERYSEKEIRFNLMVVCQDLKLKAQREVEQLKLEKAGIAKKLRSLGLPFQEHSINLYPQAAESIEENGQTLSFRTGEIHMLIEQKEAFCHSQDLRSEERKEQNIRRKHNYVPLIIQVLKTLAKKNKIGELIEKATKKP